MTHEWLIFALGIILTAIGWLIVRVVGHLDAVEEKLGAKADKCDMETLEGKLEEVKEHTNHHSEEIRDTRSAIARIEGGLGLPPFPYTNSSD